jgi:hypothetical protein
LNSNFKDSFIKLPNNWYDNIYITNEEITLAILLYRNYTYYQSVSLNSIETICEYMYINTNSNKRMLPRIKNILLSMQQKNIILNFYDLHYLNLLLDDINKHQCFYVELSPPPEENYFMIKNIDIDSIFKALQGSNLSKFNLIRYFIACMRVTNNENNFGYLSQSKLKKLINDSKTIQNYNKILQDDLNLIRYNNDYLTPEKYYCTTFISTYDNKNFDKLIQTEVNNQHLVYTDKIVSNTKRSIKQKQTLNTQLK